MKISTEVAEEEFNRFADGMDLYLDTSDMDAEDLTAFNKQKIRIMKAIENGHLVIDDAGKAVYTPFVEESKYKEPITFNQRTGASLMAMDGKRKGHDVAKTYSVMAQMCGLHPKIFGGDNLVGTDIKVCEALFALLMD